MGNLCRSSSRERDESCSSNNISGRAANSENKTAQISQAGDKENTAINNHKTTTSKLKMEDTDDVLTLDLPLIDGSRVDADCLTKNLVVLRRDIVATELLTHLESKKIITHVEADGIRASKMSYYANKRLIDLVMKRGPDALHYFITALEETGQRHLAGILRKSHIKTNEIASSFQNTRQSLKNMYLARFRKVYPFSLPFTFDIENTWVSLALKEGKKDSGATEDHADLLEQAFKRAKMLIIEGNPATGKTSLMRRLAYEWAKEKQELLCYDLVLYAEFREVLEKTFESIVDLVLYYFSKTLLKEENHETLENLMNAERFCKEHRILVLLDGYDESSLEKQCSELKTYLFDNMMDRALAFNVVITTRKSYLSNLRGREGRFAFAEVLGFITKQQKEKYIFNHFLSSQIDNKDNIAAVHNLLNRNENLNKLAETPLFLTFICLVHEKIIDGTLVELYCNIIRWLIDRHQQDNPDRDIPALFEFQNDSTQARKPLNIKEKHNTIQNNYLRFPQLLYLGKMALNNLKKDVFQENDITEYSIRSIVQKVGLIRKDEFYDQLWNLATTYSFPHRTIQEFLAACYCICSNDPTNEWLLPIPKLNTIYLNEFEMFLLRIALSDKMPIQTEKRKYYLERIDELNLDITFDAFNITAGLKDDLINWFLSQCTNVQNITLHGKLNNTRNTNDTSLYDKSDITSKMSNPKLLSFRDLIKLHSLEYWKYTFEDYSHLVFANCPSLKNLQFSECEMQTSLTLDIATLLVIDIVEFIMCTFEADSQLFFTNCSSLKNLTFSRCEIKSNTNLAITTLSAIDTAHISECTFEANSQLAFTNCPSLKNLTFSRCKIKSSTIVGIATLPAIDTVQFDQCTFSANSQLSFTNCPSLKNLTFSRCKIKSSTIVGIAALPAIDTVQFYRCKIDLAAWQSITDQISNSSVKYLQLTFGEDFNNKFLLHLQQCNNVEEMDITIEGYTIRENYLLSFSHLIKLCSLTFGAPNSSQRCTFSANSQLSFTNSPSLKNLRLWNCEMKSSTIVGIATLPAIGTVQFDQCTFSANSKLSFTNCPSLKKLEFDQCEMENSTIVGIAALPAIDTVQFKRCTFSANSQLLFTNCPSLKNLRFWKCAMKSSTIVGIAALPAIDTVQFYRCKIDLAAWQSITDQISNSSVKYLQLTFGEDFNNEFLLHLQQCNNVEEMDITIEGYTIRENYLLSFSHLIKLCSLTFGAPNSSQRCTFSANSQLSFTNSPSLKNLRLWNCEMKSSTIVGIATLPAIGTVQFDQCTFSANSKLSFTNCPSLKKLEFDQCEMENSTIVGIAALPAIDTVQFKRCNIDLATWQSITDQISNIKYLHLSADFFVKESYPEFLHHLLKCERIQKIHVNDVYHSTYNSILKYSEESVTANLTLTAQKLLALTSITISDEYGGSLGESERLSERSRERIEKAGQQRNSTFSIKYVE